LPKPAPSAVCEPRQATVGQYAFLFSEVSELKPQVDLVLVVVLVLEQQLRPKLDDEDENENEFEDLKWCLPSFGPLLRTER
jgi:hypothetical protein